MKKFILALAFTLGFIGVNAQEQEWYTDMNKAVEQSVATKKPLMLFFTGSDWCGWCMKLQKEVFKTEEFTTWAKENVILVELDFPRRKEQPQEIKAQNAQISQALKVRGYPTVWFVTAEKNAEGKTNLNALGNTGYVAGGPAKWIESANPFIKKS
ncbi:thioredoxin [Flavobacterium akiainvivens]|uniref:Thioredoxin n=1 Tax=Flavobacterium akiainvivens TaxID=1202724 RepID=A0A0M9VJG3_9FLAO|nr:thioredoxin family protein [Flavobacterium akiainvivens]KOS07712.1 thioredoxin [Flavobacterium akiainvivens]SFQ24839.1 protein disulfide-isomerase [Flavobacterium akiainvivens]